ncbi:MAG: YggS family pyridoxal phosphate-dependent enzyme [Chloroflexota bacterium]
MIGASQDVVVAIAANLARVRGRIAAACARAGRDPNAVTLVAVTKTRSSDEMRAAYACGVRHMGENRVEEAEDKVPALQAALRAEFAAEPVTWHLIGHIQSRKAARAAALGDVIHSVDSVRLAQRLERCAAEAARRISVLLEMNVSGEASKFGLAAWDAASRAALLDELAPLAEMRHLQVRGLMTMAPIVPDPEQARPVFRALRELADFLRPRLAFSAWSELSMGMTDDFEVAIEEGATLVRIGRAIFEAPTCAQEDQP